MQTVYTKTKVLITVMTYPHPSQGYQELVCTAGVTEDGEWVRLYPIDYRYRPSHQKFQKYQWVEVELAERGEGNDQRKESRKPSLDSIRLLGERLDTKNNIEESNPDWKPEWQNVLNQFQLFGPQPKPLAKIPFKFSCVFECEDSSKPHNAMIEDWELGVLYLKEVDRLGTEQRAAESVKNKFFDELCAPDKDTQFFMGTVFPYNTWIVLGVFWPPKIPPKVPPKDLQMKLF